MDIFLAILGIIVGLAFFLVGVRLAFFPKKFIIGMMNYKYKSKSKMEPQKNAIIVTIVMGALLMLGGGYYIFLGIASLYTLI
ncbi:MAG: hypothetical protein AB7U52_01325 [Candidatus Izemoplasmatales bacterium]